MRAFYLFIFRLARNPEALDVIDRSWTVIDILRLRHGVDPTRLERSMAAHKQILRALSRRDAGAALSVILTSNERTKEDLLQLARQEKSARRAGTMKAQATRRPVWTKGREAQRIVEIGRAQG